MMKAKFPKVIIGIFGLFLFSFWVNARAEWTEPVRISEPGGCLYPQIVAQGDTLHVAYTNTYGGSKVSYVRSGDYGIMWSEHQVLSDTVDSYNTYFPRIIVFNSNVIILWKATLEGGVNRKNIGYSISQDNGLTWSETDYIFYPNWEHILYFAAASSDSFVNIILNSRIGQDLVFFDVRSTDFGESWSEPEEIFRAAMSSRTDQVSYNNMVHYVWGGFFNWEESGDVYYMRSTDHGISWSENIMLSEDDNKISHSPAICVDERGNVACTWWDFKYSPYQTTGDVLIRQSFDQGENWLLEEQVTTEHRAIKSDVCWVGDSLFVVWYDRRFGPPTIYYVSSSDSIHDWSDKQRLEDDPEESRFPVVAASNGKVYVAWADDRCDPDTNICGGIYFTRWEGQVGVEEHDDTILTDDNSLEIYPNPFNSVTTLTYSNLKRDEIQIFNISGQLIRTLKVDSGKQGKIIWDATDAQGNKVSSGIYFARARIYNISKIVKLIYIK